MNEVEEQPKTNLNITLGQEHTHASTTHTYTDMHACMNIYIRPIEKGRKKYKS